MGLVDPGQEGECLDSGEEERGLEEGSRVHPEYQPQDTQDSKHHSVESSQGKTKEQLEETLGQAMATMANLSGQTMAKRADLTDLVQELYLSFMPDSHGRGSPITVCGYEAEGEGE